MKKAFFITIMSALLICSCQKENEEVYSCNKHLNEWAHENLQARQTERSHDFFRMERTGKTTSHENVPVFGRTSGHL